MQSLSHHKNVRKYAKSLWETVVGGKCWRCSCRSPHFVTLRLDLGPAGRVSDFARDSGHQKFRIMLSLSDRSQSADSTTLWQEIEVEAVATDFDSPTPISSWSGTNHAPGSAGPQKGVHFANKVKTLLRKSPTKFIADLCPELRKINSKHTVLQPLGSLESTHDTELRYDMFLCRQIEMDQKAQSLADLLASGVTADGSDQPFPVHEIRYFSRRERLYIAVSLVCNTLHLHGSWLKSHWSSRDIMVADDFWDDKVMRKFLYVCWCASDRSNGLEDHGTLKEESSQPQCEILVPLGQILVELSLGQTLTAAYRRFKDESPLLDDYSIALRLVQNHTVFHESGNRYDKAVRECLSGLSGRVRNAGLDNEKYQTVVFENIVMPLLTDWAAFEGEENMF